MRINKKSILLTSWAIIFIEFLIYKIRGNKVLLNKSPFV